MSHKQLLLGTYERVYNNSHFSYSVETSNGIKQNEQGQLTNVGTDNEGISVRGEYSYTGDDGQLYRVVYVADQNGFQPEAAHIPK